MTNNRKQSTLRTFINSLMNGRSEEERIEAEHAFMAYLQLAKDIVERRARERKDGLDTSS